MLNITLEQKVANGMSVTDARELQKRLKAIDPTLRTQLIRDAKDAGKPLQGAIKNNLSGFTPLSGMRGKGRMGFGQGVKFDATLLSFRARSSRHGNETSLVSVRTKSPIASVVDMAGKSGRFIGKGSKATPGYSREFQRNGKTMKYKVTTQGISLIRALGSQPSRLVWPAVEKALPAVENAINTILINAYKLVNRSF